MEDEQWLKRMVEVEMLVESTSGEKTLIWGDVFSLLLLLLLIIVSFLLS